MRKSGILAPCAALVFAMLGGCHSLAGSSNRLAAGTLVATLLRSSSGTPVGKATIGMISIDATTFSYYLEIEVCYHGQNEVTPTMGTPYLHAVHFEPATSANYPANVSIPLDFQSISGPLGHNFGYVKMPINITQYNALQQADTIKISNSNLSSGDDLIYGPF
jgi:hypothetical protein